MEIPSGFEPGSAARTARNVPAPVDMRIQPGSAAKAAEQRSREVGAPLSGGPVGIRLRAATGAKFEVTAKPESVDEVRAVAGFVNAAIGTSGKAENAHAEPVDRSSVTADVGQEATGPVPGRVSRLFRRWFGR